jgi:hypothetical protein
MATISIGQLVADLQVLGPNTTRDTYRKEGTFSETAYRTHFGTFTEFYNAAFPEEVTTSTESETNTFEGDRWVVSIPKTPIHTLEELLEYCKVDLGIWEVERFVVNKWEMGYKDPTGFAQTKPLFQVKATLIKRKAIVDARAEIERLKEEAKKSAPLPKYTYVRSRNSGNMLEVNIPDTHFGKMAWAKETLDRSYDTPIAQQTFLRSLSTLIDRCSGYTFDQVLFVVGNDLLNSDDELGRTTKGTFVSTDGRYQKTFVTVRETITAAIEKLRELAPVKVVMVSGNHDELGVWHLGDSLECYFAKYDDVEIDNSPAQRKYHRHGDVLLCLTHGDKGKREDYPLLIATERSRDFGETKFREIHTGHIHQTKLQEWHGVRVRILPSLSPPDAWHSENGFTGQQRNAEAYVWNDKEGLIAQFYHNDDAYSRIETDRILVERPL